MAKFKVHRTNKDAYVYYKDNYKPKEKVNKRTYIEICEKFNDAVLDTVIYEKNIFLMPCGIGKLYIAKYKKKIKRIPKKDGTGFILNAKIDFAASWKLWREKPELYKKKYIYASLDDTGDYYFIFKWNKQRARTKNTNKYFLKVTWNKRIEFSKYLLENPTIDYV